MILVTLTISGLDLASDVAYYETLRSQIKTFGELASHNVTWEGDWTGTPYCLSITEESSSAYNKTIEEARHGRIFVESVGSTLFFDVKAANIAQLSFVVTGAAVDLLFIILELWILTGELFFKKTREEEPISKTTLRLVVFRLSVIFLESVPQAIIMLFIWLDFYNGPLSYNCMQCAAKNDPTACTPSDAVVTVGSQPTFELSLATSFIETFWSVHPIIFLGLMNRGWSSTENAVLRTCRGTACAFFNTALLLVVPSFMLVLETVKDSSIPRAFFIVMTVAGVIAGTAYLYMLCYVSGGDLSKRVQCGEGDFIEDQKSGEKDIESCCKPILPEESKWNNTNDCEPECVENMPCCSLHLACYLWLQGCWCHTCSSLRMYCCFLRSMFNCVLLISGEHAE